MLFCNINNFVCRLFIYLSVQVDYHFRIDLSSGWPKTTSYMNSDPRNVFPSDQGSSDQIM